MNSYTWTHILYKPAIKYQRISTLSIIYVQISYPYTIHHRSCMCEVIQLFMAFKISLFVYYTYSYICIDNSSYYRRFQPEQWSNPSNCIFRFNDDEEHSFLITSHVINMDLQKSFSPVDASQWSIDLFTKDNKETLSNEVEDLHHHLQREAEAPTTTNKGLSL